MKIFLKGVQDTFTHSWTSCLGCTEVAALVADLAGQTAGGKNCQLSVNLSTNVEFGGSNPSKAKQKGGGKIRLYDGAKDNPGILRYIKTGLIWG